MYPSKRFFISSSHLLCLPPFLYSTTFSFLPITRSIFAHFHSPLFLSPHYCLISHCTFPIFLSLILTLLLPVFMALSSSRFSISYASSSYFRHFLFSVHAFFSPSFLPFFMSFFPSFFLCCFPNFLLDPLLTFFLPFLPSILPSFPHPVTARSESF